jgi:carboxymethylenebutenolidase
VVGNGFGDQNNVQIAEMHVFRGHIFAAVSRARGTGLAQLWRSPDGQSWTQVTSFTPPFQATGTASIVSFADSGGASPQYVYLGTAAASGGSATIYRSTDGTAWTQINGAGTGWSPSGNFFISPHMVVQDSFLYAGAANNAGAQVWRRPVDDSTEWMKVLDFATIDHTINGITYLYVFGGVIHAGTGTGFSQVGSGTGSPTLGPARLYSSASGAPGTWLKNDGVGDAFGNPTTNAITSMVDFNGVLYLSTRNVRTGGELWSSPDAIAWTKIVSNGFGNALNYELHNLRAAHNQLWIGTLSKSPALFQVWRSSDGTSFVQSNADGFGDANNTSQAGDKVGVTIGFGDFVYWGGTNEVSGAQAWRVAPLLTNPVSRITTLSPSQVSAGGEAFTLTVNGSDFATGSVVQWNDSPRPTTFVSGTRLTAPVAASDISTAGSVAITVATPAPGGEISNAVSFTIAAEAPTNPPTAGCQVDLARNQATWSSSGASVSGFIARPQGDGPFPAVLVLHTSGGLTDHEQSRASQLAGKGYVALAPDYFAPEGITPGQAGGLLALNAHVDRIREHLSGGVECLKSLSYVDTGRMGTVGFSLGGYFGLLVGARDDVKAVVSYYGSYHGEGASQVPTKYAFTAVAAQVKARILMFHGDADNEVRVVLAQNAHRRLREASKQVELVVYPGVGHRFDRVGTPTFNAQATADAAGRTLAFLP